MGNRSIPTYPRYSRLARDMGERLRAARLRRRLSVAEMAERMDVSRPTLYRLENGDLSIGLSVLVRALGVLGLENDLGALALNDVVGHKLADAASTPRRRRAPA